MTEPMRRPVSQVRAGDLIAPDDGGTVYVVCAISQPVGTSRRVEVVDARTGEAGRCLLLPLREAVLTVPGQAQWVETASARDDVLLVGLGFAPDDTWHATWDVDIDQLGRPGWEEVVRGERSVRAASAA